MKLYLQLLKCHSLTNMMSGNSEIWLLTVDQEAEEDNTANRAGASHITKGS